MMSFPDTYWLLSAYFILLRVLLLSLFLFLLFFVQSTKSGSIEEICQYLQLNSEVAYSFVTRSELFQYSLVINVTGWVQLGKI